MKANANRPKPKTEKKKKHIRKISRASRRKNRGQ